MTILRITGLAAALAGVGLACHLVAEGAVAAYEEGLASRARHALAAAGYAWAAVEADGQVLRLSGTAPDPLAGESAAETLMRTVAPARVEDATAAAAAPPPAERPPMRLVLQRDGLAVVAMGRVPDAAARAGLGRTLAEIAPRLRLDDLTRTGAAEPGVPVSVALAAEAVAAVAAARVVLEPGRLSVSGLVADDAARARLEERLAAVAGEAIALELSLSAPPPVVAPFAVSVARAADGAMRLESCAARTAAEAEAIRASVAAIGPIDGAAECAVGLGAPPLDWAGAVEAVVRVLGSLPSGRAVVRDRHVGLTAGPGTDAAALADVEAALRRALPEGFVAAVERAEVALAPVEAALPPVFANPWLVAEVTAGQVVLNGRVSDDAGAEALATLAAARFPGRVASAALTAVPTATPDRWEAAAIAGIEALATLSEGRLTMAPGRLTLEGRLGGLEPAAAGVLHRTLSEALPRVEVTTRIEIDLAAAVAAVPLSGPRCAHLLNAVMTREPVRFAPGSATLSDRAQGSLDEAAALLTRCDDTAVEIGGHTDSQGSEDLNQRLSQARAEAVRDALLDRGVPLGQMAAKGYGEAEPIADNATEAGRARNRRIAFRAIGAASVPSGDGAGKTAEAAE